MTGLQWTNAVVLACAGTMAMMLGVVCLLYGVHMDEAPQLRENWPMLTRSAALFAGLTAMAGIALYGLLRSRPWRWYAEAALAIVTVTTFWLLWRLLVG